MIPVNLSDFSDIRDELNEYFTLCNKHNYIPTQDDVQDIVNFLLLFQTGVGHMCESDSYLFKYLTKGHQIITEAEKTTYDPTKDTESVTGTIKAAGMGAGIAVAGIGIFIAYLFKRGKVKKAVKNEVKAEMNFYKKYAAVAKLKKKVADIEGKTPGPVNFPAVPAHAASDSDNKKK